MQKFFRMNNFSRSSGAGINARAWKQALVALLAIALAFGASLPAFATPMAGCDGFSQVEIGAAAKHQVMHQPVPNMPCKCTMHDCVMVSCCGLAAGLPSDAIMTPAHE